MKKKIAVIFSFYNEEKNISKSVNEVSKVLESIEEIDYELIYVNDCSTDSSLDLLKQARLSNNKIKIVNLSRRFGHMPGIMAGLRKCESDAAIYMDIDLQDPPEVIREMINYWLHENCDVVFTTRKSRPESFFMKIITNVGYKILKYSSEINITKNSGDFRLISRRVINEYVKFNELNPFFRFLVDFIGFKKKQIFYERKKRENGNTNFSLYQIILQFFEISLIPFTNFPLRFALFFGITTFFICMAILIRTGYLYFIGTDEIGTTSIFGAILLFGGIQSLTLGLLAIYIGLIFKQTRNRPLYIIESEIGFNNSEKK